MTFDAMIEKIMTEVDNSGKNPFIIWRENNDWNYGLIKNNDGVTFDWVMDAQKKDPFSVIVTGADFLHGSYPFVYDKVLVDRLHAEYGTAKYDNVNNGEYYAILTFIDENIANFSSEATEYIISLKKPLAELNDMLPISLKKDVDNAYYNENRVKEVMAIIEEMAVGIEGVQKRTALTAEHCLENSRGDDFTGKLLIVKAASLSKQYRDAKSQIVFCTHGNGARPDAMGRSIFCKELHSDKTAVYYRNEIEGVADMEKLPEWAKNKLALTKNKKPSITGQIEDGKETIRRADENKDKTVPATKRSRKQI